MRNIRLKRLKRGILLTGAALLMMAPVAGWAQSTSKMPPASQLPAATDNANSPLPPEENRGVSDIVVTAQRRTERLQDVPLSVAVVSGDLVQSSGAVNLQQLTSILPDVHIVRAGPSDRLYIRGIGSGDNLSFDQSVATFVDGVYHGRSRSTAGGLLDIDRIEILKGPQSVFFGNSAIGGAINVTTRRPTDQLSGDVFVAYNFDWDQIDAEAAVGGPITSTLSGRIAANYWRGQGWLYDDGVGSRVPRTRDRTIRGQLRWEPTAALTVNAKAENGRYRQQGGFLLQLVNCPPAPSFSAPAGFCLNAIANGVEARLDEERASTPGSHFNLNSQEYVLSADYDLGGATLTSTTAFLRHDLDLSFDADGPVPADLLASSVPEHYRQFSQEVRLASAAGGSFDYIVGGYFQRSHLVTEQDLTLSFRTPAIAAVPAFAALIPYLPLGQAVGLDQTEHIYSGFGSLTWHASDRFRLIGGIRGTIVDKRADKSIAFGTGLRFQPGLQAFPSSILALSQALTSTIGPSGVRRYDRTDRDLLPSATVQYDLAHDIMAYGSYSRGFKSGGFNGQDTSADQQAVAFAPETVDAFEAGLKMQLLNRRMTFNLAAFRSTYHDLQVGGTRPGVSLAITVQNAGGARTQGIEFENRWAITNRLTSNLSFTLLDSKYTAYPNANATSLQTVRGQASQDLSGAHTPYAPTFSGSWRLDYDLPLTNDLSLKLGNATYFTTDFSTTTNNDPFLQQGGYAKIDSSIGVVSESARWELDLLVRNVTNKVYLVYGAATPASVGSYSVQRDPPRSVTVQLRWHF